MIGKVVRAMITNEKVIAMIANAEARVAEEELVTVIVTETTRAMVAERKRATFAEIKKAMIDKEKNMIATITEEVIAMITEEIRAMEDPSIKDMWLPYALVNIMYRGVLVCASLKTILNNDTYKEKFIKLWENAQGKHTTTDVRLYVTPLHPFLVSDEHFMDAIDLLLRNPIPTELYESNDGDFLYTHFDCLHLVLPLCKKSEKYFSDYPGVKMTDEEVTLRTCHDSPDEQRFPPVLNDCIRTWLHDLPKKGENDDHSNRFSLKNNQSWILANKFPEIKREPPTQKPPTDKYVLYTPTGPATATSDEPKKYTLYTKEKVEQQKPILTRVAMRLSFLQKQHRLLERCKKLENDNLEVNKALQGYTVENVELQKTIEDLEIGLLTETTNLREELEKMFKTFNTCIQDQEATIKEQEATIEKQVVKIQEQAATLDDQEETEDFYSEDFYFVYDSEDPESRYSPEDMYDSFFCGNHD